MSAVELGRLRLQPATVELPIMMLSADTASAHIVAAMTAGADDYLVEPTPDHSSGAVAEDLGKRVRRLTDHAGIGVPAHTGPGRRACAISRTPLRRRA